MLRDRFICGINSEQIQRKLLSEETITYQKAYKIALAFEATGRDIEEMKASGNKSQDVHVVNTPRNGSKWNSGTRSSRFSNSKGKHNPSGNKEVQRFKGKSCLRCGSTLTAPTTAVSKRPNATLAIKEVTWRKYAGQNQMAIIN